MNVYEAIEARRTIRDFSAKVVDRETLTRILSAGMKAPSHNHLRKWRFVVVEDEQQRMKLIDFFRRDRPFEELEALVDGWGMEDERQKAMYLDAIPKQAKMLFSAGALVIPCFYQAEPLLESKQSLHELNAFASIWACIENILIVAASEGIFGVTKIVSSPDEARNIRSVLRMPEEYEIPCYLALGYSAGDAFIADQIPINANERVYYDWWA